MIQTVEQTTERLCAEIGASKAAIAQKTLTPYHLFGRDYFDSEETDEVIKKVKAGEPLPVNASRPAKRDVLETIRNQNK